MNIESLNTFVDVADAGSFAGAAKRRGDDPSKISRVIAGLEAQLGVRLFQRTTRRMTITPEGQAIYEKVQPLLEELADVRDLVSSTRKRVTGLLRVTASVAFGTHWLVPRLDPFLSAHPDLRLDLQLSDAIVDLVEERIDIAIRLGKPAESSLVTTKLLSVDYRAVSSSDWAAARGITAPQDLQDLPCVAMNLPGLRSELCVREPGGRARRLPLEPRIVMNSAATVRAAMLQGLGFAVLPDWLVDDDIRTGRCVDLLPELEVSGTSFDGGVWLVYPDRRHLPARVRLFVDFLKFARG